MSLRVVIVDDEPLALSLLSAILADVEDVEVVAQCRNGREAVEAVISHSPDVMFLDIQMPEMNGFDVIAAIQADIMPIVIFTTAYAEYAVDAFKVQVLDYVLKPLADQEILNSLARVRAAISAGQHVITKPKLLETLHDISQRVNSDSPQGSHSLIIKDATSVAFIGKENIDWLEAAGDYVCVHSGGKTRISRATLKSIESDLDAKIFHRIHRSTIVNITKITELIPAQKGEAYVVMSDGKRLKVSRGNGPKLKSVLRI